MTWTAERILADPESSYDIAAEGAGAIADDVILGVPEGANHDGQAYVLWMELTDLYDLPDGPYSMAVCIETCQEVARDWLATDHASAPAIAEFFDHAEWVLRRAFRGPDPEPWIAL